MSVNTSNEIIAPTINYVKLNYKQNFPTKEMVETINGVTITPNGVAKNTIKFKRLEDMIVMCLSAFVHDYVHDYNLGTMHNRVIKGNITRSNPDIPSLFESLGIKIGNKTFKIISYNVGGHRDVSMYDDSKFEDVPIVPGDKQNFINYLNSYETPIVPRGGFKKDTTLVAQVNKPDGSFLPMPMPDFKIKSDLGKGEQEGEQKPEDDEELEEQDGEQKPEDDEELEEQDEELEVEEGENKATVEEQPIVERQTISEEFVKSVTFSDVEDVLIIPSIPDLDFGTIVDKFEKNADFLAFHSSLNTYVITYLGYESDDIEDEDKNIIMNNAIISSINYIINDFDEASREKTLDSYTATFYADIFRMLLLSYKTITNKTNKDFRQNVLDILNSPEVLYQFIIFYVSYLSVEDYSAFEKINNSGQGGGAGTPDGEDGEDVDGDGVDGDGVDGEELEMIEGEGNGEDGSSLLPSTPKQKTLVPEYVYITHNNLLTTIARGMFIKLGIWKKIFFPDRTPRPDEYVFGFEQMNQITYEKLVELYPIDPELGNRNNELLILEILILKRLLLEMSPSKTLTFGAKIDDDLKNYMDAFYYDYFIKDSALSYKPEIQLEDEVTLNPDVSDENEKAAEELFEMCEEDCENEFGNDGSAVSNTSMGGAKTTDEGIEMINLKHPVDSQEVPVDSPEVPVELPGVPVELQGVPVDSIMIPSSKSISTPEKQEYTKPKPPAMPILFDKLKKMYQNNIYTIKQLQKSKIEPITIEGKTVDNLYDLLKLNETLVHTKGTNFNISAPKYKFVINNAANIGSNINGSKLFYLNKFVIAIKNAVDEVDEANKNNTLSDLASSIEKELDEKHKDLNDKIVDRVKELTAKKRANTMTINEFLELEEKTFERKKIEREEITPLENKLYLIKLLNTDPSGFEDFKVNYNRWFKDSQAVFGLYRNLQRGIFCPTSSMMDAMDNCSLKYNTTEPKEVGTSYSEIIFEDSENNVKISFGGVVLNYNQTVNGNEELTARLYYELVCNNESNGQNKDTMTLSTLGIKVSESNDLKARVAYQGVVNKIKQLYDNPIPNETVEEGIEDILEETVEDTAVQEEIIPVKKTKQQREADKQIRVVKDIWTNLQYQYNPNNFNSLLSATALKTMGDYLQECQACFKWGGYVSTSEAFPTGLTPSLDTIKDKLIYRSVSQGGIVVPYDENGNALRLGIQGDRPSGFRSIYMLLNGTEAVNDQSITGYMFTSSTQNPSRTLLVARNKNIINDKKLEGSVIFVTRELQTPQKEDLLKELEFLNVKDKQRKVEGIAVEPDITGSTIEGSPQNLRIELNKNPNTKIQPLKNSAYADWIDYETPFVPKQEAVELEIEETDRERELRLKREERERKLGPEAKAEKERQKAEAKAEKERLNAELKAEKERLKAEEKIKKSSPEYIAEEKARKAEEVKQAEKAKQEKREAAKLKAQATSAERKKLESKKKMQIERYGETEDGKNIQINIKENNDQIEKLKTEIKKIIEENKTTEEAKSGRSSRRSKPEITPENQALINSKKEEITKLDESIKTLETDFENNAASIEIDLGGNNITKSNKRNYQHKNTKRRSKNSNKLTKRHKKSIKTPKKTRKI